MDLEKRLEMLYDKDSSEAFTNLKELSTISEKESTLYTYFDMFSSMMADMRYGVRIRGFILVCKQSKWDIDKKIDSVIETILFQVDDEKPTAVRMKLQALEDIIYYKPTLNSRIKDKILAIDILSFKESMQGLIEKDMQSLLKLIDKSE